jgi:prostamide/prostaglandin F2alpha synthase
LIGVGLERLGMEEFVEGNFFAGELFVDENKASFRQLGFKRISLLRMVPSLFSRKWKAAKEKADTMGLGGNLSGDGQQTGGVLVVGQGGAPTMFTYKQDDPADHPDNAAVLEALGIQAAPAP